MITTYCCERASRAATADERAVWDIVHQFISAAPDLICDACYADKSIEAAIVQLRAAQRVMNTVPPSSSTRKPDEHGAWYVEGAVALLCAIPVVGLTYGPRKDEVPT